MENKNVKEIDVIASSSVTTENTFVAVPPKSTDEALRFIGYALVLDVIGFGACSISITLSNFIVIFATISYLCAAYFALHSIIKVFSVQRGIGDKISITFLGIVVGGWGLFWGIIGIGASLDGGFMI